MRDYPICQFVVSLQFPEGDRWNTQMKKKFSFGSSAAACGSAGPDILFLACATVAMVTAGTLARLCELS